jgi:hypothetical protein
MITNRVKFALAIVLLAASLGGCASTQNLKAQTASFDWSQAQKKVLMVQPDIVLSELTAGGMTEPRADWTQTARTALATNFERFMAKKSVEAVALNELSDPHEIQLAKLHNAVGAAVLIHAFGPQKLPTKGTALDWTLGPGTSAMRDHYGTDYAMFVFVRDSYASAGRQAVIAGSIVLCALTGVCPNIQGGTQVAFVSLVDLRTGNIVWFKFYASAAGDLRDGKNVGKFVNELLKDFPL